MKQVTISDFVPGRILYHVYGVRRRNTDVDETSIEKYIVLEKPKSKNIGLSGYSPLFSKILVVYRSADGTEREYVTSTSLGDCGVLTSEGQSVHNLNRVFVSKADALRFCNELRSDIFSRKEDADYAKANPPGLDRWLSSLQEFI